MDDLIPILYPITFFVMLAVERLLPHRAQPPLRAGWLVKGIVFFAIAGLINSTLPELFGGLVAGHSLLDLSSLGTIGGALLAVAVAGLLDYWVHRLYHRVTPIWRWTHQLHHSAERVDLAGFSYNHPLELAFSTTITPITAVVLGMSPHAAILSGFITFVMMLVSHLDTRTPTWIGYVVQRPEAHAVHHQRGVHAYNYGLPIWDLAFGTFRNPAEVTAPAGFWDGASRCLGAMLVGRDVGARPES